MYINIICFLIFSNQNNGIKVKALYRQSLQNKDSTRSSVKDKWSHLVQLLEELYSLHSDVFPKELEFT